MLNEDYIAKELYENYCRAVGGKAFNGDALPDWAAFSTDANKQKQVEAWRGVARRAMQLLS